MRYNSNLLGAFGLCVSISRFRVSQHCGSPLSRSGAQRSRDGSHSSGPAPGNSPYFIIIVIIPFLEARHLWLPDIIPPADRSYLCCGFDVHHVCRVVVDTSIYDGQQAPLRGRPDVQHGKRTTKAHPKNLKISVQSSPLHGKILLNRKLGNRKTGSFTSIDVTSRLS